MSRRQPSFDPGDLGMATLNRFDRSSQAHHPAVERHSLALQFGPAAFMQSLLMGIKERCCWPAQHAPANFAGHEKRPFAAWDSTE